MDKDGGAKNGYSYRKRDRIHWLPKPSRPLSEAELTNATLIKVDKHGNIETDAPPKAKSNGRLIEARVRNIPAKIYWVKESTGPLPENPALKAMAKRAEASGAEDDNRESA